MNHIKTANPRATTMAETASSIRSDMTHRYPCTQAQTTSAGRELRLARILDESAPDQTFPPGNCGHSLRALASVLAKTWCHRAQEPPSAT